MTEYRIRWAVVTVLGGNCGRWDSREVMCIAERKSTFLGISSWWSLRGSEWRRTEAAALADIERERRLHEPLPEPRVVSEAELIHALAGSVPPTGGSGAIPPPPHKG